MTSFIPLSLETFERKGMGGDNFIPQSPEALEREGMGEDSRYLSRGKSSCIRTVDLPQSW